MSGRRHHFIPQFLQRGFASHSTNKDSYTWVYRKGEINPFNSNIKNIGIESDFYSEEKETTLDDAITKAESEFASFIDDLRKAEDTVKVDKLKAAKLIAHLEVRTKNLRLNFRNTGTHVVNEMVKFLEDTTNCERFVRNQVKIQAKSMIDEELIKNKVPRNFLPKARMKLAYHIEQKIPEMTQHMSFMMGYLRENLPVLFNNSAKSGHIKGLLKSHTPLVKVSVYEKLNFQIISTGNMKIPLGDSGVIFNIDDEPEFKSFFGIDNKLLAVILPISSTKLLLGSNNGYSVDINKIPKAIVSCSLEYFISSEESMENVNLTKYISDNTALLSQPEMEKILVNLIPE